MSETTTNSIHLSMRVLKIATCPTNSGRATLAYQIGCSAEHDIYFRVTANTGGGLFSPEWVSLKAMLATLETARKPLASFPLLDLLKGRSINTPAFLMAAMKSEGIVRSLEGKIRGYELLDTELFNRILVIGDEVSGNDKRQENDKIKGLITGTSIHINEKFQPEREQPNLLNFIFLSNHHDAMFVNDHDRRFFVWEIVAGQLPAKQADAFVNWRDSGGLEALHYFLLHYDISDFNPRAPAPMTAAKRQMVDDNRSDLESWLADIMASDVTKVFGGEVVTSSYLCAAYAHATDNRRPSAKAVVGACKRLGSYAFPTQIRLPNGSKLRALTLARHDFWKTQPEAAWAVELQKEIAISD